MNTRYGKRGMRSDKKERNKNRTMERNKDKSRSKVMRRNKERRK